MSLRGKDAIVTGSNSGIGLGIAEALAHKGAAVALNSYTDTPEDHAPAARIATETGAKVQYINADLADPAACRMLVDRTAEVFGGADILVSSASKAQSICVP